MGYHFQFETVLQEGPAILDGLWLTIVLSVQAIILGGSLGIALAAARGLFPRFVAMGIDGFVEMMRNTPFLVQLFIIYLGLPGIGIRLSAETASLIAMTLNLGAYSTEIVRAGVEATHRSQIEAAVALAMTPLQVFRHVIVLPALAKVWPALSSQFVLMLLASSVCSFISVQELSGTAAIIESQTFRSFEVYILVTLIYLALALLLRLLLGLMGAMLFPAGSALGRMRLGGGAQ